MHKIREFWMINMGLGKGDRRLMCERMGERIRARERKRKGRGVGEQRYRK